jgi:hypothetical protein
MPVKKLHPTARATVPLADQKRYETLKGSIADLGFFCRGSIVKRFMPCGKPGCRCQATPPELHGPYYQWTRKVGGKTVTVRLTREQADALQDWIANGRCLDKTITQMQSLSLRIAERLLRSLQSDRP